MYPQIMLSFLICRCGLESTLSLYQCIASILTSNTSLVIVQEALRFKATEYLSKVLFLYSFSFDAHQSQKELGETKYFHSSFTAENGKAKFSLLFTINLTKYKKWLEIGSGILSHFQHSLILE